MTTTTATVFFFDSAGNLWATCAPDATGAEAFGPRWTARRADLSELGITPMAGRTDFTAAEAAGLTWEEEEWTFARPVMRLTDFARTADLSIGGALDAAFCGGLVIGKYADPTEPARTNLSADDASAVAFEDPSLLYIEAGPVVTYWRSADGQSSIDMRGATKGEALAELLAQCATNAQRAAILAGSFEVAE